MQSFSLLTTPRLTQDEPTHVTRHQILAVRPRQKAILRRGPVDTADALLMAQIHSGFSDRRGAEHVVCSIGRAQDIQSESLDCIPVCHNDGAVRLPTKPKAEFAS